MTVGTYLEALEIILKKKSYNDIELSEETEREIKELFINKKKNIYEILAQSIAPEIHGHLDVKKALLLQMIGGFLSLFLYFFFV